VDVVFEDPVFKIGDKIIPPLDDSLQHLPLIFINDVSAIIPLPISASQASGVAHTKSPDELKTERKKDREELMQDSKMILRRATEK